MHLILHSHAKKMTLYGDNILSSVYLASEGLGGCVLLVTYPNSRRYHATITMGMEIERALPLLNQQHKIWRALALY